MFVRYALIAMAALVAAAPSAQTTVRDSVRMQVLAFQFDRPNGDGTGSCGSGVYAIWPNVLQDLLGTETRTYGYRDYGRVATEGMFVPGGAGETGSVPDVNIVVPEGYLGHRPLLQGNGGYGPSTNFCGQIHAAVASRLSGAWGPLNGQPFRITEWYATFSIPDGTPIALFEWEAADALAVSFDASFESEQSREIDVTAPSKKVPVASYAWDFGDGESGAGARPTHTYDEAGTYDVRLTVTDDDGETASRTETVTVDDAVLRTRITFATDEVAMGDTITVRGTVTNAGTETLFGVRAERRFLWTHHVDEALNTPGSQTSEPLLEQLPIPDGEDEVVTAASLAPGASIEVSRDYVVERLGRYRASLSEPLQPLDTFVDWEVIVGVEGETPAEPEVPVRQSCAGAEPACATTMVKNDPPFTAEITFSNVNGEVTQAPAGRERRRRDNGRFEVNHRFAMLGQPAQCISGCVDVEVVVTDDNGDPVEGATVHLSATEVAGGGVVTPDQGGGFFCPTEAYPASCGRTMDAQPTDAEGRSRALYWFPGLVSNAQTAVSARVTVDGVSDTETTSLALLATRVEFGHDTVTPDVQDASFLVTTGGVLAATNAVSYVNDLCGKGLAYLGTAGGRVTPLDQGFLKGTKAASTWVCDKARERLAGENANGRIGQALLYVEAAKQLSKLAQISWFFTSFGLSDVGLASVTLEATSPPFVNYESDFVDAITEAFGTISRTQYLDGVVTPLMLEIHEVSYAKIDGSGVEFVPALHVRIQSTGPGAVDSKKLVRAGYTPASWLTEEGLSTATVPSPVAPGDTTLPLGPPAPARLASLRLPEDIKPGHVLLLDAGTDAQEAVQVSAVADGQADLTAALRFAHPAGAEVSKVDSLSADAPDMPVATGYSAGFAGAPTTPTLTWFTRAPAATYRVEVATDSLFTTVVAAGDTEDPSFALPSLSDGTHYWRVRATHLLGSSAWSPTASFVVGRAPGDDLASAVALAGALPLIAAEWTFDVTTEAGEAAPSCGGAEGSLWFRVVPPETGRLAIDTYGSTFDTDLSVWTGTSHPLTEVACDEGSFTSPVASGLSRVTLDAAEGVPLFVRVSGSEAGAAVVWVEQAGPVAVDSDALPTALGLGTPFPNPVREQATISVAMASAGPARLALYDALGREVAVAWDGAMAVGRHSVPLDTSRLPAGIYVLRLATGAETATQRLTVVR